MSFHRPLVASLAVVAAAGFAGCALPPVNTPDQTITVKYSMFVPPVAQGVPLPTGLPGFNDRSAPPTTVPVPKEAKTFKLASLVLNLKAKNTGPIPLQVKLYLSPDSVDPYTTAPLGGDNPVIELPRGGAETSKSFPIDVSLLAGDALKLGYTFSSPGTNETVTFQESDAVTVTYSLAAQAKLF